MLARQNNVRALIASVVAALVMAVATPSMAAPQKKSAATEVRKKTATSAGPKKQRPEAAAQQRKKAVAKSSSRKSNRVVGKSRRPVVEARSVTRPTFGQMAGLGAAGDALGLKSNAVVVLDQSTNEVLFDKNASAVLPIASLTKLMTALVVTDAGLPLDEPITITEADIDTLKGSGSRLAVGTTLTRGELLHLALMSSENRAAHALGRTFPGGLAKFVEMMNVKAKLVGMMDTRYVDPTGLSPHNQSNAKDLATLASVAYDRPLIRDLSTSTGYAVESGHRTVHYRNSNQLVSNPDWTIGLQKTGYISEAGRCLVMQATVAGRQLIMVFLDSAGKLTRIADAERVRRWVEGR